VLAWRRRRGVGCPFAPALCAPFDCMLSPGSRKGWVHPELALRDTPPPSAWLDGQLNQITDHTALGAFDPRGRARRLGRAPRRVGPNTPGYRRGRWSRIHTPVRRCGRSDRFAQSSAGSLRLAVRFASPRLADRPGFARSSVGPARFAWQFGSPRLAWPIDPASRGRRSGRFASPRLASPRLASPRLASPGSSVRLTSLGRSTRLRAVVGRAGSLRLAVRFASPRLADRPGFASAAGRFASPWLFGSLVWPIDPLRLGRWNRLAWVGGITPRPAPGPDRPASAERSGPRRAEPADLPHRPQAYSRLSTTRSARRVRPDASGRNDAPARTLRRGERAQVWVVS